MPDAARITDFHTCPMVTPGTPPVPHVGGPISKGSPNVEVRYLKSARMSDQAVCVGPPDAIMMGSPTVLMNHLPAARKGDITMHGGGIKLGEMTVDIGMGAFPYPIVFDPKTGKMRVGNHLVIEGSPEFQGRVLGDLGDTAMTPSSDPSRPAAGRQTLDSINGGQHDVTIVEGTGNGCGGRDPGRVTPGVGSPSRVTYNSHSEPPTTADPNVNRPADVGLHHELAHADHNQQGTNQRNVPHTRPNMTNMEEQNTIEHDNRYRDDRGIPQRPDHANL